MGKIKMKTLYQIGMIVSDAEAVLKQYENIFELENVQLFKTSDPGVAFENHTRYGEPCDPYHLKVALFDMAGVNFELIEPLNESGDPYSDWLKAQNGKGGLHHICAFFEQDGATVAKTLLDAGGTLSHGAEMFKQAKFCFVDSEPLNLMFEVVL